MMAVASLSAAAAPAWERNTQSDTAAGLESPPIGTVIVGLPPGREPSTAGPARVGFAGLRQSLDRFVGTFMVPLPRLPSKVIASRPATRRSGGPAVSPIRAAVVAVPLVGVENTAPWYEHMMM